MMSIAYNYDLKNKANKLCWISDSEHMSQNTFNFFPKDNPKTIPDQMLVWLLDIFYNFLCHKISRPFSFF